MSTYPLMLMLFFAALGLGLAARWSSPGATQPRPWYALLALMVAVSAVELFLLSSQLALRLPALATLGVPFPLALGPLWWRAQSARQHWSIRRWSIALFPAALAGTVALLGLFSTGMDALAAAGNRPAQVLVFLSVVTALLSKPRQRAAHLVGSGTLAHR